MTNEAPFETNYETDLEKGALGGWDVDAEGRLVRKL